MNNYRKKTYTYDRGNYLHFPLFLCALYGIKDYNEMKIKARDKAFCHYQCECARLNLAYEDPALYGVKGLFG